MECNECDKEWFNIPLEFTPDDPLGFEEWCNQITQCKYVITLPDNTTVFARLFRDHNGRYNNYDYKNYLLNRYNEIQDI